MRTKLTCAILILLFSAVSVKSQTWQWARSNGGDSIDRADIQKICIDNSGSSYYCGTYSSNPCYFHTDTLVPNGLYDMFIAKYDANGNEMWVKGLGGNNSSTMQQERIISICYNNSTHSILFSVLFQGTVVVGNDTLYGNYSGNFCASMDTNSTINWVKQTNGALLIATEGDNNFYGMIRFSNGGMIDSLPVTSGNWMVKYDLQGNLIWAKKIFNGNGTTDGFDAWFDNIRVKQGKIFGFGSCTVDSFITDTITVHANFPSDQYVIACFDTNGSALWAKPTSGRNSHYISDIEVDDDLNSYITGPVVGDAIFDGDTIHTGVGGGNFLAKYDSVGNYIWANYVHNITQGFDLTLDNENTIYVVDISYDTAYLCNDTIFSSPSGNTVIIRYDTSGSCISWFKFDYGSGPSSIICDASNNLISAGNYSSTLNLGATTLTCIGLWNSYITKCDALTGIGEGERETNKLVIYANPNDGKCNITIPDEFKHEKKLTLSIFDNTGKLIQQGTVEMNEEKVRVNLQAEAKGIYNVTLSNGKKSYGGKIVFE